MLGLLFVKCLFLYRDFSFYSQIYFPSAFDCIKFLERLSCFENYGNLHLYQILVIPKSTLQNADLYSICNILNISSVRRPLYVSQLLGSSFLQLPLLKNPTILPRIGANPGLTQHTPTCDEVGGQEIPFLYPFGLAEGPEN